MPAREAPNHRDPKTRDPSHAPYNFKRPYRPMVNVLWNIEGGWLKSVDERRGKLKVRRILSGSRLEVLHLPADALEHSIVGKSGPIGPSTGEENDLPGSPA
jgi:hypothetical protein